jgi:hypothetical protein
MKLENLFVSIFVMWKCFLIKIICLNFNSIFMAKHDVPVHQLCLGQNSNWTHSRTLSCELAC